MNTNKKFINSIIFISCTLAVAILSTAYMEDKTYLLNFYILPILYGAYYYGIYGGLGLATLSSALSLIFAHHAGVPIAGTPIIVKLVIFVIVGFVAGLLQRENNRLSNYFLEASLTDKLTGLYNFGCFSKRIKEEISRADRYKRFVGLIMIDIDHFKEYNDTYGHQNGNVVLETLAGLFKRDARQSDVIFRYGGEEFAVIIPEVREQAYEIAERLRKAVENEKFPGKGDTKEHITISAGVSYHPCPNNTPHNIVERADKALYKAKETGRNRVCMFEG